MLVVFEGIDGSGKNTQIAKLALFFRQNGVKYKLHKYPTAKAKDAFAHLEGKKDVPATKLAGVFADDIIGEQEKILREVADDFVVVCDRYLHSTLAYQGAKIDYGKLKGDLEALHAIVPDIVFLLDLDPGLSAGRKSAQKKPDRFEGDAVFLSKVRGNYLHMAKEGFLSYKYVVIDASQGPDGIFTHIITQIEPLIAKRMGKGR